MQRQATFLFIHDKLYNKLLIQSVAVNSHLNSWPSFPTLFWFLVPKYFSTG